MQLILHFSVCIFHGRSTRIFRHESALDYLHYVYQPRHVVVHVLKDQVHASCFFERYATAGEGGGVCVSE